MNNTNPPAFEQVNKPPERPHDTPGMMLRKGRENANLTHATVSEALHLTIHYIKALENDDHSKLPGATFVKGYLRTYARYLKLDVNAVLASYERDRVSAEEMSGRTESLSRIQKRHDQTFRWAVVTAVIVVAGVAAGWWFVGKDEARAGTVTATEQMPAEPQASRTATAGSASASQATVQVNAQSNVQSNVQAGAPVSTFASASPVLGTGNITSSPVAATDPATMQTMPLATTGFPAAVAGVPAVAGAMSAIEPSVTNSTSPASVNASDAGNALPAATSAAVSETGTLAAQAGASAANAAAPAVQSPPTVTSIPEQNNVALTVTPTAEGARQVTLISEGADIIQLYFKGSSWVEIDDGASGRLYNETLNSGDAMTLHGTAPFQVLLGDASQVELTYNSEPINLASQIRSDKTARFLLGTSDAPPAPAAATPGANP